jgi:hypothetical protein
MDAMPRRSFMWRGCRGPGHLNLPASPLLAPSMRRCNAPSPTSLHHRVRPRRRQAAANDPTTPERVLLSRSANRVVWFSGHCDTCAGGLMGQASRTSHPESRTTWRGRQSPTSYATEAISSVRAVAGGKIARPKTRRRIFSTAAPGWRFGSAWLCQNRAAAATSFHLKELIHDRSNDTSCATIRGYCQRDAREVRAPRTRRTG